MAEYIKTTDAITTTWMILRGMGYAAEDNPDMVKTVAAVFNTAPAADVVEVRHGRWNEVEHGENGVLCECTACKEWMLFYYGFDANYCPNCGAKMDGEQDE